MVHRLSYSSRTFSRTFPAAQLFGNPQFSAFTHHNMLWCVKAEKKASIIIAYCWWKSKSFFKKRRNWEVWFPTPYIRSFLNQPPIYSIISDISNLSRSALYVYSLLLSSIFVNSSEKKFYFSLYYILWFLTVAIPAVKNRFFPSPTAKKAGFSFQNEKPAKKGEETKKQRSLLLFFRRGRVLPPFCKGRVHLIDFRPKE